jgi:serine/threonine protein kinase
MLATFETKCSGFETLNIILPFAGGGNLYGFLRLEQETRWEQRGYPTSDPSLVGCLADWRCAVFREIVGLAEAVAALHEDNNGKFVIHCDIKPANVLIQRGIFKLADFGLSRFKDSDETSKTEWHRGTALYSPPERESLSGRGRDVWALGCVFLETACMIRYAFQDAVFGMLGATQEPKYEDLRNIIDIFELDRKNSISTSGERTAIYHRTMDAVRQYMRGFHIMRPGLRKRITVDGMFQVIERMMDEDQKTRITAMEAAAQLRANYLSLQEDPQLQEAIRERHNPGGPPADDVDSDRIRFRIAEAGVSFTHGSPATISGGVIPHDNGLYRHPMIRTATAPAGSSGANEKMIDAALYEKKRPVSSEDTSHRHPPANPRLVAPLDLEGAMQPSKGVGMQNDTRSSSMEENSSNKRRKTDVHF